ncbi:helix-turn-helix domain-containing protein [Glutamicibacter halophytocola]|uniref:helix-turn-helix domain-containing protein n=1 Tax=Glutamicibacter halophytocola TaxID=1933880 RepID=UPI0015C52F59|nr:helix-turn-helix domain-containing protein [Glutamicibacter halophytocola]NQD40570.1 helix-turn-helix domain-containing protein [Glutamicibacter halophytocola]
MSNSRTQVATADAAKRLDLSTRQIARMVADGRLTPAFKAPGIRGAYIFDVEEIERVAKGDAK